MNAGGTLNNQTGPSIVGTINLNGGSVTNTGGGTFSMSGGQIKGYGSVSGFTDFGTGSLNASGGTSSTPQTLAVDGGSGVTLGDSSGVGESMSSAAYNTLDLKGTFNYIQPVTIAPSGGTVQLNGATFATSLTWALSLNPGTVNVTNNSTLGGTVNSSANLTVNSGKNLNASGATFTNNSDGTVFVDHATATWGNFTNNGVYKSDPSTQTFNSLTVGSAGYLTGGAGDMYQIKGDFTNNSTQNTLWSTGAAELDLITGPSHNLALAGADLGATMAGFTNNFAWGTVDLTGQTLSLSDDDGSALYVGKILGVNFTGTTVTNITSDGFDIYYDPGQNPYLNGLTYNLGGEGVLAPVHAVPEPSSIALLGIGAVSLLAYAWRKRRRTA